MPTGDDRGLEAIQTQWREALRQLAEAAPGSPDADRLAQRVQDLARDYRAAADRVHEEARRRSGGTATGPHPGR